MSFTAPPGAVTGFVGVNGAGKTTTLRIILGLVAPTSGEALVAGRPFAELDDPRRVVGAVLEGIGAHPGQSGRAYLGVLAAAAGIGRPRVDEVLEAVGLTDDAHRRVAGYSLGMRQRLGLAGTLLGDPVILVLDEPANGLDPLGMRWIRGLLRDLADEGRCVLVSSHQLSELEAVADRVVMIHKGRVITETGMDEPVAHEGRKVVVRTPEPLRLAALAESEGGVVTGSEEHKLTVHGLRAEHVGELAANAGIVLHSLSEEGSRLEEMFLSLSTGDDPSAVSSDSRRGAL